jgi:gluconolactonase
VTVFREQSNQSNGNSRDLDGNLITCEHQSRQVTRTDKAGKIRVLATHFQNKRLNSPNDLVCKSDGSIWFTDPPYGLPRQTEGKELDKQHVFRLDKDGQLTALVDDFDRPNGLAFSPDERKLYVADSGKPRHIRVFTVTAENTLIDGKVFCTIDKGVPDGIRTDAAGRLYSSAGDGVHIFSVDGKLIGKVLLPETCANLCFGGKDKSELYMTASKSVYRIKLAAPGK